MGFDVLIPELCPPKDYDKAPKCVEDGEEEKADRFAAGQRSAEHPHHFPRAEKIDCGKNDPEEQSKASKRKDERLGIWVGDFPSGVKEASGANQNQKKDEKICVTKVRQVKPTRRAVGNGANRGWRIGVFVTEVGSGSFIDHSPGYRNQTDNSFCFLLIGASGSPNFVMAE